MDEILIKEYEVKPYVMTEWEDHLVDSIDMEVIQQGTPLSARNLNKVERGIYDAYLCLNFILDSLNGLNKMNSMHKLDVLVIHNLCTYPDICILEFDYGCGMESCGDTPCGGSNGKKLRSTAEHLDRNSLYVSVEKQYNTVENIEQVSRTEYIVTFVGSTLSLYLMLLI